MAVAAHNPLDTYGRPYARVARRRAAEPADVPAGSSPQTALAVVTVGAAGVLALWWVNTPQIASTAEWFTHAGRITGLLAAYAIVVVIALMARVPALEWGIGADRLTRWHAMGGRYVITLSVAHTLFILWGYAVDAQTSVTAQGKALLLSYPGVLSATVALLLLVGVGIASARAARRRMRYETWHFLHFYTYLAVALSFSHQLATGAEFVESPATRVAWYALYGAVAGLVVWYRWLTPLAQALRHDLRVHKVIVEGPNVVSVVLTGRKLERLGAQPGQFFRWRFLTRHHWWAANPYSLSAAPKERFLRITVEEKGDHSGTLHALRPGTRVIAEGPYGALTPARRTGSFVLLIAGGMGITPMRALLEGLPAEYGEVTLLYRASTDDELLFEHELQALAEDTGARLLFVVGPRGGSDDPTEPGVLRRLVPGLRAHDVYICASPGLTTSLVDALRDAGVRRSRIHTEDFGF